MALDNKEYALEEQMLVIADGNADQVAYWYRWYKGWHTCRDNREHDRYYHRVCQLLWCCDPQDRTGAQVAHRCLSAI
jgi:hypothetical protein